MLLAGFVSGGNSNSEMVAATAELGKKTVTNTRKIEAIHLPTIIPPYIPVIILYLPLHEEE
jgi:hypothetical protein